MATQFRGFAWPHGTHQPIPYAPTCAQSSALATALFVLGPDAGRRFATRGHLAALFLVNEKNSVAAYATPEFENLRAPALDATARP